MGLLRPIRLFLALFALITTLTPTSAQSSSSLGPKISDGHPIRDTILLLPLNAQPASNRIDLLLRPSELRRRQQQLTCATNYTACEGTDFCCPDGNVCCPDGTCCGAGTYCTTIGGVQGCCKVGHICNQLANECTIEGQQRCPNENFCCAAGDTCFRDADGHPKCSSGNTSSSGVSIVPTPTSKSSLSSKPAQTATPVSTSSTSQPTFCRLKSDPQARGFLSRRSQTPGHPSSHRNKFKRRSWF